MVQRVQQVPWRILETQDTASIKGVSGALRDRWLEPRGTSQSCCRLSAPTAQVLVEEPVDGVVEVNDVLGVEETVALVFLDQVLHLYPAGA